MNQLRTHWARAGARLGAVSILTACFCMLGCGPKPTKIIPTGPAPKFRFVTDGNVAPTVSLTSVGFASELITPVPIALTETSVLEFLPIVRRTTFAEKKVSVELLSDGGEIMLGEFPAYVSLNQPELSSDTEALLGSIVRADLGKYRGREAQFRWRVINPEPGDKPEIGLFKVYKKAAFKGQPNILLICSDTHRYDYALTPEGEQLMPRLTQFRKEAMTYRRAYSDATWTLPSIASTMTGRFPRFHVSGRRSKSEHDPLDGKPLENVPGSFYMRWAGVVRYFTLFPSSGMTTLTKNLQDEGYFTSWIAGNIFYSMSGMDSQGLEVAVDARTKRGYEVNAVATNLIEHLPTDRPNFLLVHYLDVHQHRLWYFNDRFANQHPLTTDRENVLSCYRDAVRDSDRYLGELLDMWQKKFGFENTMVVFYSDHGEHLRDPGYGTYAQEAGAKAKSVEEMDLDIPLLDHGNSMDESLLHVPLVIRYPDALNLRGESDVPAALVDLFPTVLDVAQLKAPAGTDLDGESLLEIQREGKRGSPAIHADYQLYGMEMSSIREGDLKYVVVLDEQDGIKEQYLVNTGLPFTEQGEKGQRVENAEALQKMGKLFQDYTRVAKEESKGLKSDKVLDVEKESKGLDDLGYLKSKPK